MTTAAAPAATPAPGTNGPTRTTRRPQHGPPLPVPVLAYAALTIAAVAVSISTPHPDATGAAVLAYDQAHGGLIRLGAFLLLGSAVPLAVAAAVFYRRLRALGITAPGSAITLVGGILASAALSLSALFSWTGSRVPAAADAATGSTAGTSTLARALADLAFLSGGPLYAVSFALLIAGLSVTGLIARLLPRALGWSGLVIAAAGALGTVTLLATGFGYLLPVVRFGGTLWLIAVAFLLPATRHARRA